jgi:hypothetical protein
MTARPQPTKGTRRVSQRSLPFWSASVLDIRSLALFRILLGLYVLYDIYSRLSRGAYDVNWYTSDGFLSVDDTPHRAPLHRFWFYRGNEAIQKDLFRVTAIFALVFLAYDSRFVKVGLFLLVTSYQNRNMWLHDGSDSFLRHLLFWSIFLPLHQVWSLSASNYEPTIIVINKQRRVVPPPPPASITSLACGALTLQVALMYWGTVAHRVLDDETSLRGQGLTGGGAAVSWLDRVHESEWMPPHLTAVHYALSGDFAVRNYWLVAWVRVRPSLTRAMTASAMIVETLAPLLCLLDRRRRHWHALQLAMLHLGLLMMIRLPNWQLVGVLVQVLWIPTPVWDAIFKIDRMALAKKKDLPFDEVPETPYTVVQELPSQKRRNPVSFAIQLFFLFYMIYNWCGCRGWIGKHDKGDIGEGVRLSQHWVMYGTVAHTANNVHLVGTVHVPESNQNVTVDLLRYLSTGEQEPPPALSAPHSDEDNWFLPDMSNRYPSPRWERALSQWASKRDTSRGRRFIRRLCTLLPLDLLSIELRYTHARIGPPGSKHRFLPIPSLPDSAVTISCPNNASIS